jgi:hypothetical protein
MTKTTRARCTLEFKQETVQPIASGQSQTAVARSLSDLTDRSEGKPV